MAVLNALWKGLTKAVVLMIVVGAAFIFMAQTTAKMAQENQWGTEPSYPEQLAAQHDCWTGEQPSDVKVPTHVVVRYENEVAASYRGAKAVADALSYVFEGKDNGVADVTAFCR